MSLDNLTIDFSHISFDLPNNDRLVAQQPPTQVRAKSRNRQCIPSDDEDEDEEEEEEEEDEDRDDSDEGREPRALRLNKKPAPTPKKIKKQLPSDDEDSDEENEKQEQRPSYYNEEVGYYHEGAAANVMYGYEQGYNPMQQQYEEDDDDRALVPNPNAGPVLTLVEGSHLQQLQKKQQQHQAQLAQFQYLQQLHPNQHNNRYQHQKPLYQHQNKSMSGMDLLKQLEQEKADLKRVKPKLDTSKVKIEGLLGNIPEPGSHNISFQQLQQQQKRMHKNTRPASTLAVGGYLDPHSHHHNSSRSKSPSRSPSPHRRSPSPSFASYRNSHVNK